MFRLMIADDERIVRETIRDFIDWESLGITLTGLCKNGLEAYDMILDEYPDIVLTDIKMPGLSGLDLIEKISLLDPNIHFIILSGYEEFSFAQQAMKYGIKHYLLKPCNENQIIESVKDIIADIEHKRLLPLQSKEKYDTIYQKVSMLANDFWTGNGDPDLQRKSLTRLKNILNEVYDLDFLRTLMSNFLLESLASSKKVNNDYTQVTDLLSKLKKINNRTEMLDAFYLFLHSTEASFLKDQIPYKDFIEKTMDYVNNHLSDPSLSLKWIAENVLFMNVDYVSKQFIKQTGLKFSAYLCDLRISRAKKLLLNGGTDKIYEVADKVGCGNNPQYFTQLFKKSTGLTPTAYIAEMSHSDKT
ncbi:MAG: response regulator [Oliverpabstia sp.]